MSGREIKLRVWDVENAKMLSWDDIWYSVVRLGPNSLPNQSEEIWFPFISLALKAPATKYVVEEWTGLKDRNGREIYEGDIVEYPQDTPGINTGFYRSVVGHEADWFGSLKSGFHVGGDYADQETTKVIGNIHENPDILK